MAYLNETRLAISTKKQKGDEIQSEIRQRWKGKDDNHISDHTKLELIKLTPKLEKKSNVI